MDLHQRWPHRWRTPKAKAFNSPVHGLGVIAVEEISKGEDLLVYGGSIVHKSEIKEFWHAFSHVGIQIDEDYFIVPTSPEELEVQGVVNHSCEPNAGFKNQIRLIAIKDIKAGEEITFDYAFCEAYEDNFECKCGSKDCRKQITKDDWQIESIQEKYLEYFSPFLKERITLQSN
jgi:SET domain-containing protein